MAVCVTQCNKTPIFSKVFKKFADRNVVGDILFFLNNCQEVKMFNKSMNNSFLKKSDTG